MAKAAPVVARSIRDAKRRKAYAARRPVKLRIPLPAYRSTGWRKKIFDAARSAAQTDKVKYVMGEQLDLVVRLYLKNETLLQKNDVDNLLKKVFDGLQGALAGEGRKAYKKGRLIRNDKRIYRATVEKFLTPRKYRNREEVLGSGGNVTIRVCKARRSPR